MEMHSVPPSQEEVSIDPYERCPISHSLALFRIYHLPVYRERVFMVYNPQRSRLDFLKISDSKAIIILLDNSAKVKALKKFVNDGILMIETHQLFNEFNQYASRIAGGMGLATSLGNQTLLNTYAQQLIAIEQTQIQIMANLKKNLQQRLCL